jgi:hypothetical protein
MVWIVILRRDHDDATGPRHADECPSCDYACLTRTRASLKMGWKPVVEWGAVLISDPMPCTVNCSICAIAGSVQMNEWAQLQARPHGMAWQAG